jgi:hypothetical protein
MPKKMTHCNILQWVSILLVITLKKIIPMKRLFIAIFVMLAVAGAQAQVVTLKSEYNVDKIVSLSSSVEVIVRVETCNDVTNKYCVLRAKHPSGTTFGVAMSEQELDELLKKIEEIRVGNMNLNCDNFEKFYTLNPIVGDVVEVGYFINTKSEKKSQSWWLRIRDDIYEVQMFASMNEIYKALGKARIKLQSL